MKTEQIQAFLEEIDDKRQLPGSICLVYHNRKEVLSYSSGYANPEHRIPYSKDTILHMFSMTKPITCVAALQLYEHGAFLMTDPLSDYLPEFQESKVVEKQENGNEIIRPASAPIRIRDLFTMTSGYCYPQDENATGRALRSRFGNGAGLSKVPLRVFARELAKIPLLFDPGTHWHYGYSHDLLAALVEVISGQAFSAYVAENIFRPLGMNNAWFHLPESEKNRLATLYTFEEKTGELVPAFHETDPVFESGGAGLFCTAADYMKFAEMLCKLGTSSDGVRILGSKTVKMMTTNALTPTQQQDFDWIHMRGYGYGYGVRTMTNPSFGGSNSNIGEFGWAGLAGTDLIIDPTEQLTVVYGHQRIPNDEPYIHPRLRNVIYASL
ncbi:MAG: beta-lactamase family protein [Lachnospiraceae bacterium]|jgi:CubicO group peptidase (beta-lactamase class C family)|nr:beta-lactamase family protein [Lachnospiraceae bacterium]MCI1398284.1 beta-lactamase family protein [Lachnospiraceae bacterium]MCI1424536.1 beta-lactamase family protein [Lachnospiraceae bacterium]